MGELQGGGCCFTGGSGRYVWHAARKKYSGAIVVCWLCGKTLEVPPRTSGALLQMLPNEILRSLKGIFCCQIVGEGSDFRGAEVKATAYAGINDQRRFPAFFF